MAFYTCSSFPPQALSQRRGFNLTELAIVLGVVGLVLGLVWTAASTTWGAARREQAQEAVNTVVTNMRSYYGGQMAIPFVNAGVSTLVPELFNFGVIPNSMQRVQNGTCSNTSSLCADTPWGGNNGAGIDPNGTFQVCAWPYGGGLAACNVGSVGLPVSQFFAVEMKGLTQENCIKMAAQISGSSTLPGLMSLLINGAATTPAASPATANADCTATSSNILIFIYRLHITAG